MKRIYVDYLTSHDILMRTNGVTHRRRSGNQRYERILASCVEEYSKAADKFGFRSALYLKLQALDLPMRFLQYDNTAEKYYPVTETGMRIAFHKVAKKLSERGRKKMSSAIYVNEVTASDILFWDDGFENKSHTGNQLLRRMLEPKVKAYQSTKHQLEMCSKVLWLLRKDHPSIRFLRRCDDNQKYCLCNKEYSVWRIQIILEGMAIADHCPTKDPANTLNMSGNENGHHVILPSQIKCPVPRAVLTRTRGVVKLLSKPTNATLTPHAAVLPMRYGDSGQNQLCSGVAKSEIDGTEKLLQERRKNSALLEIIPTAIMKSLLPTQKQIQAVYSNPEQSHCYLGQHRCADLGSVNKILPPPGFETVALPQQPRTQVAMQEEDRDDAAGQYNHQFKECRESHEECNAFGKEDYMYVEAMSRTMVTGLCGWE
ncbi:unnamed protein product [Cylindrotheca closterium]|uniref:Uncharacterized protein n=1 Tax=Cylindrotheca closterium TaxID=2856 RepID=A0AAD2FLA9_9STRA|nr:unnamed protein product [Cylindrotheca closterium]